MLTAKEASTRAIYDARPDEWLAHSGGEHRACYWEGEMRDLVSVLPGPRVLEIGCGPATDGKYLEAYGLQAVSADYSMGMLSLARRLNPGAALAQADVYRLPFPDASFDGFWASAMLLHLEHPERAVRELSRVTAPGGAGFISIIEGTGDAIDPKTGYYFRYHSDDGFRHILSRSGFHVIVPGRRDNPSPLGNWLTYVVGK